MHLNCHDFKRKNILLMNERHDNFASASDNLRSTGCETCYEHGFVGSAFLIEIGEEVTDED
ncbi:MAG: hypothetical protein BWY75_01760 [bacterium ADurb.Bin425]|nr:MAG: hypothetical protein BWY75_01760 [bacterium ADurb.Bin425]